MPRWLKLEPGEQYLGSFQRHGLTTLGWVGAGVALLPAIVRLADGGLSVAAGELLAHTSGIALPAWLAAGLQSAVEARLAPGHEALASVTDAFVSCTGVVLAGISSKLNRVYLTSKALVYRQGRGYQATSLAQVTGVSYEALRRRRVTVHLAGPGAPPALELRTHRPKQVAEELSQLLSQDSGGAGEARVKGGTR
jgi:hypothetical protein